MGLEVIVKPTIQLYPRNNQENEDFFYIYGAEVVSDNKDKIEFNSYGNISIKGNMPQLNIGEEYEAVITKDNKSTYAGSYEVEKITKEQPETVEEQKAFLEAVLTVAQIKNIYNVYSEDDDIVGMIQRDEFDYEKVYGLGEKTYNKLKERVLSNLDMSEILAFLSKHDIKYNMIAKLVNHYGDPHIVMQKIEKNPYVLTEVRGIGFIKADTIARNMGFSMTSPHRINSCLAHCIKEENKNGHSWISYKNLLNKSLDYLNIKKEYIIEEIEKISEYSENNENNYKNREKVLNIDGKYTLNNIYNAEKYISRSIVEMQRNTEKIFNTFELNVMIDDYCEENNIELEETQRQFFHDWNENRVLMLVGSGGTGKSWLQNILLKFVKEKGLSVSLLAPTGRASKIMENYTGIGAKTIHRGIGVYGEDEDEAKSLDSDMIIVDETSMCDVIILSKLFRAIQNPNARILFVGDDFQLPSVGVGNFLYDMLNSNKIKVTKLTKVFRQDDGGILNVATDVREGNSFLNGSDDGRVVFGKDCVFWLVDQDYVKDGVIANYKRVAKKFNQDDIVILTPTNKGKLGTVALNKEIQKIANPESINKKERAVGAKDNQIIFREGDLVMNTVNTYAIETIDGGVADIFNGDTGKIVKIDEDEGVFIINVDDVVVKVKFGEILGRFMHSWVTTIHKAQGGQYKVVIVIADRSMTYQLNANLLYTGFSRAQEYMLVLTQPQTINRSMRKFANMERRSFMQNLLEEEFAR